MHNAEKFPVDIDPKETQEWLDSIESVIKCSGKDRASFLLEKLKNFVHQAGIPVPFSATTPYINTIPSDNEAAFPGDADLEEKITNILRWNATAMVVSANKKNDGVGGHLSTYSSAATLYEVAFNHFFKGRTDNQLGDIVYIQGHASPGIYARAFLEGRLSEHQLHNFRRELAEGGGLPSYPHPRLLPDFWQCPTVSMGLGPIMAIYQARFNRYLQGRSIADTSNTKVWAFLGDGETDEPESLGSINMATRENLDNLVFVINCNLQRLDGPVRGNSKIMHELEGIFTGSGWDVIKVVWSSDWDPLLASEAGAELVEAMNQAVDGDFQKYSNVGSGAYLREHFFGRNPKLAKLVENYSDEQLENLRRGGHDLRKVYAAYHRAMEQNGRPKVILTSTIKGYALGESTQGKNIAHNKKKMKSSELVDFKNAMGIPISDEDAEKMKFYKPGEDSPEIQYLKAQREKLGGFIPARHENFQPLELPEDSFYDYFLQGSGENAVSTTTVYGLIQRELLKYKKENFGKYVVPIIPDETRTFGMEGLFRQVGIYSSKGQIYEPVDKQILAYYKEATDGQILQEGLCEAGAMSSFIAAGTSYSTQGVDMIPFYIYYSMFGFQRIGDLAWAAMDMKCKGFLVGAVAGRTTLNGEGLQHQDGQSHIQASVIPGCVCYDPAYGYELAVIIKDGLKRMYGDQEKIFYYITVYNENYVQPQMPEGAEEGIKKGMYKLRKSSLNSKKKVQLLGSGVILNEALRAAKILEEQYEIAADVWSVTSFTRLRNEAMEVEHWNRLNPKEAPRKSFLEQTLENESGTFVAVSDYMRILADGISRWVPGGLTCLGTDGSGKSSSREELRRYFEVDAECIVYNTLYTMAQKGEVNKNALAKVQEDLNIDPNKAHPFPV